MAFFEWVKVSPIERRSVRYHSTTVTKFLGGSLELSNDEREVWATVFFLSAIMHRIVMSIFHFCSAKWTTVC